MLNKNCVNFKLKKKCQQANMKFKNVEEHATNTTWAAVASKPPKQEKSTIDPLYLGEEPGFDRIVVRPTHFNKTDFDGYITCEEANLIRKAINLEENVHGTTFYRNRDGVLFITFKLVNNLTKEVIRNTIKKYFWFKKTSSTGHLDFFSGEVVHPMWEGPDSDIPTQKILSKNLISQRSELKDAIINSRKRTSCQCWTTMVPQ